MSEIDKLDVIPIADDGELELMREVAGTQTTLAGYAKEFFIDTGFKLDVGGVDIYDWKESGWALAIVFFYNAVFLMSFFYFTYTLTLNQVSFKYLSLLGNDTSRSCIEVPINVTAIVEGDIFGSWKTEMTFQQNASTFVLEMSGTSINSEKYTSIMMSFRDQLKALSAKSALRDAAWNAVAWSTFVFQDEESGMDLISSADSKYFFEGNGFGMGIITTAKAGACLWAYQWATYDPTDHTMVYNMKQRPYSDEMMQNYLLGYNSSMYNFLDACPDQYPFHLFAKNFAVYTEVDMTGLFQLKFDVHSLMIATSLNWNLTTYSAYTQVQSSYGSSGVYGIPGTFWMDPSLEDSMEPVFCLDLKGVNTKYKLNLENEYLNGNPICFLVKGSISYPILYYPVALSAHMDPLTSHYTHCSCPESRNILACNQRDYVFSLFYSFPGPDPETGIANPAAALALSLQLQQMLVDDPVNGDVKVQEFVTPLISSAWQIAPIGGPAFADNTQDSYTDANGQYFDFSFMHGTYRQTHLVEWKKLCPSGNCGAVLFETYKGTENNEFLPLNKYEYQVTQNPAITNKYLFSNQSGKPVYLKRMMCENALYIPGALEKLALKPPVSIVQPFYQCHDTILAGLTAAAGNAAGMAGIVATAFMFICGFVFLQMHNVLVSRHNVRVIKSRMQRQNDVSDTAANDGETIRSLAIPQVDKSKVDRKVKQRLDDSTMDFFTTVVDRLERLEKIVNSSSGSGSGARAGMGGARGNIDGPQTDEVDPDLRDKLDHFQRCLTFNIATAQAKLVAKEAIELEIFKEKKKQGRTGGAHTDHNNHTTKSHRHGDATEREHDRGFELRPLGAGATIADIENPSSAGKGQNDLTFFDIDNLLGGWTWYPATATDGSRSINTASMSGKSGMAQVNIPGKGSIPIASSHHGVND